ncbi:ClpXP protease specificity-enhancing factor [Parvibium lacunae]|uniref:ClpXP protease specificity-enhancing factor n=1 Tax=Parvibium lacunae TaxID=1888893 RepID=A0A368L5Y9_9BURK|nr:ClpXP protease specificity-enhancing factor [Parvibium lacunae]RCS58560.1 ClpXP protease specificity-enhancing factor [Parvibium lacunae]
MQEISTKPYFIRALYEWCMDNGYTPHISVVVNEQARVPLEFVRDGEIVMNISALATNQLVIQNDHIAFQARFGGVARDIYIPLENISAIYARETGQGMAFPALSADTPAADEPQVRVDDPITTAPAEPLPTKDSSKPAGKPKLTVVK